MLAIRFSRVGRRNRAQYRIVVQEKRMAPTGRHVAVVGSWDPHLKKGVFKTEEIKEWISKGAQVSDSVWNLLVKENIIEGEKRKVKIKNKKKEKEEGSEKEEEKEVKDNKGENQESENKENNDKKEDDLKNEKSKEGEVKSKKAEEKKEEVEK